MMLLLFGIDAAKALDATPESVGTNPSLTVTACEGLDATPELSEAKPYTLLTLTASLQAGYESNPTLLGEDQALPKGQSTRGFGFFLADDIVDFDWQAADRLNQVHLSYDYTQVFYEGLSGTDEGDHEWRAKYRHVFNDTWSSVITADDKFVTFDGHSFSNKAWICPEIDWQPVAHYKTKIMSTFANYDTFFTATIPQRDPTANSVSFEVYEEVELGRLSLIKVTPGFLRIVNSADGSDYDYNRNLFQIKLETNFDQIGDPWKNIYGTLKFIHDIDRYNHPNSHAGFAFARRDDENLVDLQLSYDVFHGQGHIQKFSLTMEYKYIRNNSNLPEFNYVDHIISAGCTLLLQ